MIDWTELDMQFDPDTGAVKSSEIVFSHVDDKDGTVRHFAIDRIVKHIERMSPPPRVITFPTDPHFAYFAMKHRGVEMHRFNRITHEDLIQYPIVMAYMPGVGVDTKGEHLIIDGIHRYCRAVSMGWRELHAYELQPEQWEPFLIRIPDVLQEYDRDRLSNQHINPIPSGIK